MTFTSRIGGKVVPAIEAVPAGCTQHDDGHSGELLELELVKA